MTAGLPRERERRRKMPWIVRLVSAPFFGANVIIWFAVLMLMGKFTVAERAR